MQTVKLPFKVKREILACGADLKGRFCFAKGDCAYISDEFGDLSEASNIERYQKEVEKARRTFKLKPKIIACDMHPEYFSTKFAQEYSIHHTPYTIHRIQHHHAHIASCMMDNKIKGSVIGVSFDGTGFGIDSHIWGGEILIADFNKFQRLFHIDYVPMPGGEAAIREPWRMALSYLYKIYKDRFLAIRIPFLKRLNKEKCKVLIQMIKKGINSPLTSSMGRLFDGVASLIGIRDIIKYEAEAAIELERIADIRCKDKYRYGIEDNISLDGIIKGIVGDLKKKEKNAVISSKFHNTIAHVVKDIVSRANKKEGVEKIVFSGGVFQNKFLIVRIKELFKNSKLKIYFPKDFSTTDTSIALGQVAIASHSMRKGS